jgi:hypothetical protein
MNIKSVSDLKRHASRVGNSFFSAGNVRVFGSDKVWGIYRQPYWSNEGYIIVEIIFTDSNGVADPAQYAIHRFEATADDLDWHPISRHASLAEAEAVLKAQGAVK